MRETYDFHFLSFDLQAGSSWCIQPLPSQSGSAYDRIHACRLLLLRKLRVKLDDRGHRTSPVLGRSSEAPIEIAS